MGEGLRAAGVVVLLMAVFALGITVSLLIWGWLLG